MVCVIFRDARREDVGAIVDLLRDDPLGQGREAARLDVYPAAFMRFLPARCTS
jgi:hypothetical protein